jgi:AraC-like DNA-binding protein
MPKKRTKTRMAPAAQDPLKGLFRTVLAGPGRTLNEAFTRLEQTNLIENVARHRARDLFGARVHLTEQEGEGYWDLTRIRDEIYVVVGSFSYKDPRIETLAGDGMIQFCVNLSGDLTLALGRHEPLRLAQPSLLVYHHPTDVPLTEWTEPSAREQVVAINIRPEALATLLGAEDGDLPPRVQALIQARPTKDIPYIQVPLTADLFDLARKLVEPPLQGPLNLAYIEALATQLLCVAVGDIARLAHEPVEQYTEREVRCLHAARRILLNQLSHPPTIPQVARSAGINMTILKKGFKALFGETVFEFSVRCRMQHALMLLREQRRSVSEVGAAVGYRHQTSFATAFRKHFGLRPKDVRRTRQI